MNPWELRTLNLWTPSNRNPCEFKFMSLCKLHKKNGWIPRNQDPLESKIRVLANLRSLQIQIYEFFRIGTPKNSISLQSRRTQCLKKGANRSIMNLGRFHLICLFFTFHLCEFETDLRVPFLHFFQLSLHGLVLLLQWHHFLQQYIKLLLLAFGKIFLLAFFQVSCWVACFARIDFEFGIWHVVLPSFFFQISDARWLSPFLYLKKPRIPDKQKSIWCHD